MARPVKISDSAKSRLEELQAQIRLETGRKVTQQELLSRLVEGAVTSRKELIESFRESTVPLSDEEKHQMQRGRFRSGIETDEDDIDEVLYG